MTAGDLTLQQGRAWNFMVGTKSSLNIQVWAFGELILANYVAWAINELGVLIRFTSMHKLICRVSLIHNLSFLGRVA